MWVTIPSKETVEVCKEYKRDFWTILSFCALDETSLEKLAAFVGIVYLIALIILMVTK